MMRAQGQTLGELEQSMGVEQPAQRRIAQTLAEPSTDQPRERTREQIES